MPKASKIEVLRRFNRLPPLRDKSAQHSLQKRNILQKSTLPVGQVVNFYQQPTTLKKIRIGNLIIQICTICYICQQIAVEQIKDHANQ